MTDPQAQPNDDSQNPATPSDEVSRRVFNRLSMAAFSGLIAGSIAGCNGEEEDAGTGGGDHGGGGGAAGHGGGDHGAEVASTEGEEGEDEPFDWTKAERHVCRGLNNCDGKGASGENACAGQGTCATVAAHDCSGQNACKGQGGCGENPGENACREQGGCAVPLTGDMWETARENFEAAMTAAGKEFGPAPEEI